MMKVCLLADAGSRHTHKWCKYLTERGCQVSVISLSSGEIPGVKVYSLEIDMETLSYKRTFAKLKYLFNYRRVRSLLKEIKPDILHAHYASSYGALGALAKYKPYIISVWGSDVFEFPQKSKLHAALLKYNLSKADYLFSTSEVMAKETAKYTGKKIEITPFGVDMTVFKQFSVDRSEKGMIIGTVKSLELNYGMEYLIRAFAQLKGWHPDIDMRLEIGGKGSLEHQLKELVAQLNIEEHVSFLGFLNQEEVAQAFNRFDIAVFPSINESFGVAAVEAQACGTPVIVSDVGGLPEATSPAYSSIVVKSMDVQGFAKAMEKLIMDKYLREEMGRNGIEYVKKHFEVNSNFDKVLTLYKNILDKK